VPADVPLLESLPPPEAGARKNVVAHAGDASRMNNVVSANFFILLAKIPRSMVKIQNVVVHHGSILLSSRDETILVRGTAKVQVPLHYSVFKQLLPFVTGKSA
jgi:hypothetical protein